VGWLDARLPYACELLNACSGSTMILPVSYAMLAWAARRPHLGYWLGTALQPAGRGGRSKGPALGNGTALKSGHDHCIPVRHTQDICQTFAKYVRRVPVKTSP
jgi:hypothetical protein